jgi:hypothetical protein
VYGITKELLERVEAKATGDADSYDYLVTQGTADLQALCKTVRELDAENEKRKRQIDRIDRAAAEIKVAVATSRYDDLEG